MRCSLILVLVSQQFSFLISTENQIVENADVTKPCTLVRIPWISKDWPIDANQGHLKIEDIDQEYALRVLVLTFRRANSLLRLLQSLLAAEYHYDSVALDILIDRLFAFGCRSPFPVSLSLLLDRPADGSSIDAATVQVVSAFRWPHGPCRALLRPEHAGLRGQWLGCWSPREVFASDEHMMSRRQKRETTRTSIMSVSPRFCCRHARLMLKESRARVRWG